MKTNKLKYIELWQKKNTQLIRIKKTSYNKLKEKCELYNKKIIEIIEIMIDDYKE